MGRDSKIEWPSELLTATPMPTSALQPFYPGIESRPQVLDACGIASPTTA